MKALEIIDCELAWWEAELTLLKHPRERLALALAIGAAGALRTVRDALAAGTRSAKTPKAVESEGCQSGPKGNAHD